MATSAGPESRKPAAGECRDLSLADVYAASDPSAPTDCEDPHTARTIRVGQLPDGMTWKASDEKLALASHRICEAAAIKALGRTAKVRDRSAYIWVWFYPTRAQKSDGARWVRCDLVLMGGTKLVNLPTDSTPALDTVPLPDKVARCLTGTKSVTTTCTRPHTWRATGAFTLRQAQYPTDRQQAAATSRRCPAMVSSNRYRWTLRSPMSWSLGDHTIVCYTKTQA